MLQEQLNQLSSLVNKLLRRNFGRGPELCHASMGSDFLVFYIRGFLSPMEEVLLHQGHADSMAISRRIVIESLLLELRGMMEMTMEREIKEFYHDWNLPNNTGMIAVVFEPDPDGGMNNAGFPEKSRLESEVSRISMMVQKVPEQIQSYCITPRLYIVMRYGILVPIEKALIARGYQDVLLVTKDEMEKHHFHTDGKFTEIFQHSVADIFIGWNTKEDRSLMCMVLK